MSESDKKWLEEALQSVTVDEVKRMRELGAILERPEVDESERFAALEELQDFVESIDNAKNLFAIGAFDAVVRCLGGDASPKLRRAAAATLSTVVQNNPKAQEWAMDGGLAPALLLALADAEARLLAPAQLQPAASAWTPADALRLIATLTTAIASLVSRRSRVLRVTGPRHRLPNAMPPQIRGSIAGQAWLVGTAAALPALALPVLLAAERGAWAPTAPAAADEEARPLLRRAARKALFAMRAIVVGSHAEAVKTALLRRPAAPPQPPAAGGAAAAAAALEAAAVAAAASTTPPFFAALAALLGAEHGSPLAAAAAGADGDEDGGADASDARESALYILHALASESPPAEEYVDDTGAPGVCAYASVPSTCLRSPSPRTSAGDTRKPRSLYGDAASAAAGGGAAAAGGDGSSSSSSAPASSSSSSKLLALAAPAPGAAGATAAPATGGSAAPAAAAAPAPTPPLSLAERLAILRAVVVPTPPAAPSSAPGPAPSSRLCSLAALLALHLRWTRVRVAAAAAAAPESPADAEAWAAEAGLAEAALGALLGRVTRSDAGSGSAGMAGPVDGAARAQGAVSHVADPVLD